MRSSKSRSRSKQNRPRSIGNIINRVFDSSGPEGKVRGTPQQIIEKYLVLARDAQLSNDRVAAENFLQHAEHYTRMLGEAQRELAAEQEVRRQSGQGGNGNGGGHGGEHRGYPPRVRDDRDDDSAVDRVEGMVPVLGFDDAEGDSGLVETPESQVSPGPTEDAAAQRPAHRPAFRPDYRRESAPRPEPRPAAPEAPAPVADAPSAERQAPQTDAAVNTRRSATSRTAPRSTGAKPAADAVQPAATTADADKPAARSRRPRKPKDAAAE